MPDQGQRHQPDPRNQNAPPPEQRYGSDEEYAQHGTLDSGYDEGAAMGEDEWSEQDYERGAKQVDRHMLDEDEPQPPGRASDIDRMVGGMIGADAPQGDHPDEEDQRS